jgi:hypothetical protein
MPQQTSAQIQNLLSGTGLGAAWNNYVVFYFSNLGIFKAVSILLTAFFIGATLYFMIFTNWLPLRIDRVRDVIIKTNLSKKRSIKAWRKIERHFFAGDDNSLKLALIDADNTLNEALRLAGFRGENLGDRLKNIDESQMPNVQDLWEVHKLRNRIAHEPDFKINREIAEKALTIYENAFKDLGLLD